MDWGEQRTLGMPMFCSTASVDRVDCRDIWVLSVRLSVATVTADFPDTCG